MPATTRTSRHPQPSTPPPNRRAAIYTRISSDDGTALGVARQEQDCRALAQRLGWDVAAVFTDNDVSASTGRRRPAFERMLEALRRADADAVIVWDLDRFTRRPLDFEEFYRDFVETKGTALASVGGDVDLATPQGLMVAGIKANVARHEAQQASRRIRRKTDERAKAGLPHGKARYGWTRELVIGPDGTATRRDVIDETAAAVIREATTRVCAGEPLRAIVRDLNAHGWTSPAGLPWEATTLRQVLLRAGNAGLRVHRGEVLGEAAWDPIIERLEWERARAILTDPTRNLSPGREPVWLLSGIARCGRDGCQGRMRSLKGRPTGKGGNQRRKYVCRECLGVARVADPVDEYVEQVIVARLSQPDAAAALVAPTEPAVEALAEAADLRRRLDEAADAFAARVLDMPQLTRINAQLRPLLAAAEGRARAGLSTPDLADLVGPGAAEAWSALPIARRRAVVELLLDVVILRVGKHKGSAPFDEESVAIAWKDATT